MASAAAERRYSDAAPRLLKVIGAVPIPDLPDITADEIRVESTFGATPIRVLTYRPVKSDNPLPTIVHIHGGGPCRGPSRVSHLSADVSRLLSGNECPRDQAG